jgi:hypothetical protein
MSSPESPQRRIRSFPRLFLLLALFALPVFVGLYADWKSPDPLEDRIPFATVPFLPSAFCILAFMLCVPEVMGITFKRKATLRERWSGFVRWTAAGAAAVIFLFWCFTAIYVAISDDGGLSRHYASPLGFTKFFGRSAAIVAISLFASLLVLAAPAASEKYLLPGIPHDPSPSGIGWRAAIARWVGRCGAWFLKLFSVKLALFLGAALILASLILPMDVDYYPGFKSGGYSVLVNARMLPTSAYTIHGDAVQRTVARLQQDLYVISLLLGLAALVSVAAGKRGIIIRTFRPLLILSGILALFVTTDYAFAYLRFMTDGIPIFGGPTLSERIMENLILAQWLVVFALSLALWFIPTRPMGETRERNRIVAMILILPPFCFALFWLSFAVLGTAGYAALWIGSLFLWWGFLQSGQESPPSA